VRVHVDPAGRNHQSRGIDLASGDSLFSADPSDPTARNCDVAAKCRLAGTIDDGAAANNDIVHANPPKISFIFAAIAERFVT
jgi:hypothetical protein